MIFFLYTSVTLLIIVCSFLILLVLIQKGRGGGLSSAFGGAGGNTAFGSKTGDVLTWATSVVFGIFILLAVAANLFATGTHNQRQAPPALPTAAGAAGQAPAPGGDAMAPQEHPAMP